jgi:uncharacterized protein YutE (UPF0331/DUF86 family)
MSLQGRLRQCAASLPEVRLARTGWLDGAEALLSRPMEEFQADIQGRDLASFYFFLAVQACIDLAAYWIADAGWGPPDDAASAFALLADRQAIDLDLAEQLRAAVDLSNQIEHEYGDLDHSEAYQGFRAGITALRRFLAIAV